MEVESEIPFLTKLQDLVEDRKFKRTLILWLKYFKSFNNQEIARFSGESHQNVRNAVDKWESQASVEDLPRQGRPSEISPEDRDTIIGRQLEDRFKSLIDIYRELNTEGCQVSYDQVKRVIGDTFIKSAAPLRIKMSEENKAKRVLWIESHSRWRRQKWSKVVWTDEKMFELYPQRGRLYAKILPDEYPEDFPRQRLGVSPKIMFWGAISGEGKVFLDVIEDPSMTSYSYSCFLYQRAMPAIRMIHGKDFFYQQDNAPPHRGGLTSIYLEIAKVKVIEWPPQSPDLNPIEQVWNWLAGKIKTKSFQNLGELRDSVFALWEQLPNNTVLAYIEKLESKMDYVYKNNGEEYIDHKDR